MVKNAEWVAGITLTDDERKAVAAATQLHAEPARGAAQDRHRLRHRHRPFTSTQRREKRRKGAARQGRADVRKDVKKPDADADLAFLPLHQLAELVRTKKISSTELTKLYLARLKKYDPALLCVVSLTEELALKQAAEADKDIAAGKYRGPLHGIPWAAKDLIAYPGYKTTWGAGHFKEQTIDAKATVAERLDAPARCSSPRRRSARWPRATCGSAA